jgi:arylsulfatase A-like enzyme
MPNLYPTHPSLRQTQRPNVIIFFTDQQRWDSTGVHGNPLELTPNFDRIALEGTHLYNAFTPQPVCGPARACLQTGLYATQSGCFTNGIPLPQDSFTMAHAFNQAGYRTAYIGKWHLARDEDGGPVPPEYRGGYTDWLAANTLEFTSDAYRTCLYDNDGREVRLPGYRVDALADAAIDYIDGHQAEPFFLFLSFLEPHFQNHRDDYPAPTGYAERYSGRWTPPDLQALGGGTAYQHLPGYWGMVKRLDEALGRILDALRSLGQLENTILVFTSDHGNHFKTRNAEYKRSCHDSSVRIPLAICGPGFDGGGRIQQMISLLDLPPTLLDACAIPIPPAWSGRSILPLLRREPVDWPADVFIQISESQVGRALRTSRWKYCIVAPGLSGTLEPGAEEYSEDALYDLLADPYELNNLIGYASHQPVSATLRERLLRRMVEAGEPEPRISPAPLRPSGQKMVFKNEDDQ